MEQDLHGWHQSCLALAVRIADWLQQLEASAFHSHHSTHLSAASTAQSFFAAAEQDLYLSVNLLSVQQGHVVSFCVCLHACVYDAEVLSIHLHLPVD